MKNLWRDLAKKGPIVALAPMDGYCDSAYRQVCKKANPDVMTFSEFYSADGLVHSKFLKDAVLPHAEGEKPLIIQIFWKDPEMFVKAAHIIEQYDVAGIDVNMGCPAKKVVRSGHGSSLIINKDTAFKIVEELNNRSKLPISVKTRLGFDGADTLIDFGKGLENAGASLLSIHGRTTAQAYKWDADFSQIFELKKNVWIPVIWNGDVMNYDDGIAKMKNLDGFMIWRGSFGNPWCFLPGNYKPSLEEVLAMMTFHAEELVKTKWEKRGTLEIRKHLVQYLRAFPWARKYRKEFITIESVDSLSGIIWRVREEYKDFLDKDLEYIWENAPH